MNLPRNLRRNSIVHKLYWGIKNYSEDYWINPTYGRMILSIVVSLMEIALDKSSSEENIQNAVTELRALSAVPLVEESVDCWPSREMEIYLEAEVGELNIILRHGNCQCPDGVLLTGIVHPSNGRRVLSAVVDLIRSAYVEGSLDENEYFRTGIQKLLDPEEQQNPPVMTGSSGSVIEDFQNWFTHARDCECVDCSQFHPCYRVRVQELVRDVLTPISVWGKRLNWHPMDHEELINQYSLLYLRTHTANNQVHSAMSLRTKWLGQALREREENQIKLREKLEALLAQAMEQLGSLRELREADLTTTLLDRQFEWLDEQGKTIEAIDRQLDGFEWEFDDLAKKIEKITNEVSRGLKFRIMLDARAQKLEGELQDTLDTLMLV
ncbi:hypothetical protein [Shimazuella kribbensis]|uniref:hypothetical protein n=1 Tax=Shimazuella kribbensis TaxID=139808 RepID=UPI0004047690|nr:hypothetical protein [Shimazuella kribbensis]